MELHHGDIITLEYAKDCFTQLKVIERRKLKDGHGYIVAALDNSFCFWVSLDEIDKHASKGYQMTINDI